MKQDVHCWHCGTPAPKPVFARTPDGEVPSCCAGCAAAIETIHGLGLGDYYCFRGDEMATVPAAGEELSLALFDLPELVAPFIHHEGDEQTLTLALDGVHCAACVWLIERALKELPGVRAVSLNLTTLRVRVTGSAFETGQIARRLHDLGYRPRLPVRDSLLDEDKRASRQLLARLLVAGLGSMQAMMYAVALYIGAFKDFEPLWRDFFRIAGVIIATPVVFYSGWPFISGAWKSLKARVMSMDVPVSLAILMGWGGSVVFTATGGEHVYFESIAMFVFFLLISRWIEQRQRARVGRQLVQLQQGLPLVVRRRDGNDWTPVPAMMVRDGDRLQVRAGETIPVDGLIADGSGSIEEATLTGEAVPVQRAAGGSVHAGTRLCEGLLEVIADGRPADSLLARIGRMVDQAVDRRHAETIRFQWIASRFITVVLLLTVFTLWFHWSTSPAAAFEHAIAVLVITCPCALALAGPLSISASVSAALRQGVLVADPRRLLRIRHVTDVMLDKTGTLTQAAFRVVQTELIDAGENEVELQRLAAALEAGSSHPLALAVQQWHGGEPLTIENLRHDREGVSGCWRGHEWRISRAPGQYGQSAGLTDLALYRNGEPVYLIRLEDPLRDDAAAVCDALRADGLRLHLASGDQVGAVAAVAQTLAIDSWRAGQQPTDKAAWIGELQQQNARVLMTGDGVNDALAMVKADVGVAVAESSALAREAAGIYLLRPSLAALPWLRALSRRANHTLRQNTAWALTYNISTVPFAVAGMIPPWLAAIGMSASSLLVTWNAARMASWKS
ncbi:MAG: heavy metal translocating P-type ATPase [Alcanivoracaceae bacterium]